MLRSSVELLPDEVRQELETRLIQGGFSGYVELTEWLNEQGFEIGKSSVHRYGKKFEDKLRALKVATDQAKAIAEASEDDAGAMNDALIRLVQTTFFNALVNLKLDEKNMAKIGTAVARLSQAAVRQKRWAKEMEGKVIKQTQENAARAVEKEAKRQGTSAKTIDALRAAIMQEI